MNNNEVKHVVFYKLNSKQVLNEKSHFPRKVAFNFYFKTIPIPCSLSANDANNNDGNNIEICIHFLFVIKQICTYKIRIPNLSGKKLNNFNLDMIECV